MLLSEKFIYSGASYCTFENFIPAPMFRKTLNITTLPESCSITVSGQGFYKLYVNGTDTTKGLLAPYISNPDDIIYYDSYDLMPHLVCGKNAVCFVLGNGMFNSMGGQVWDFHIARYRAAPRLAFAIEGTAADGNEFLMEADESVKTAPSPIYFDDLRSGTRYDAREETPGWSEAEFDDTEWADAVICEKPRGEKRICQAEPIKAQYELKPVSIRPAELSAYTPSGQVEDIVPQEKPESTQGMLYDFGVNAAGICRLKIEGKRGQRVELQFLEFVNADDKPDYSNINFYPDGYSQRDVYILKGEGTEVFEPDFTYHGFRYCLVLGLEPGQAQPETLTYIVCNSDLKERADFCCSDETANALQRMTRVSSLANFYYFPTDCPHREKNGWTGDAALSSEHMLINLTAEKSFREWLNNIRAAQAENGSLPGIVPTGGWGFKWGNGPAWDAVLTYLPYYSYIYSGDRAVLSENAAAIMRYLEYISQNRTERGTVCLGLGDWCPVGDHYKVSLEFTDSVTVMSIAEKAKFIFDVLGLSLQSAFAQGLYDSVRAAVRKNLIDLNTKTAQGSCQSAQAMAIYFGVFDDSEKNAAADVLLKIIHAADDKIDFGILGARVIFHVLSDFGYGELAYNMICRPEYPSYGSFVRLGLTALPEDFREEYSVTRPNSLNHHFFGDISNWFITKLAGIRYNPTGLDTAKADIRPDFIDALSFARAHFDSVYGRISCDWEREGENITLTIDVPEEISGNILLPFGWRFADRKTCCEKLQGGKYLIEKFN